jgi:predicted PurR-regulated permease PerM
MRVLTAIPGRSGLQADMATIAALAAGITVVGTLFVAREILIPICLAVLISFVLAPLTQMLRRRGLPQSFAVVAVVALTFGTIIGIGALGASQISQLSEKLPQFQENIRSKIRAFKISTSGSSAVARATTVIEDLGKEISGRPTAEPSTIVSPVGAKEILPIPVEIRVPNSNPIRIALDFLAPILNPLASIGLVLLFVVFILLQQQDLRDRVIKLLGTKSLHRTTEAMDEAAIRLSRYFLLQTALNAGFGLTVGIGLWLIGVPSPVLWGSFATLMRFVPYIGSILAAVLPLALAAAVDPGWTMLAWTMALFLIGEPVMGQIIEPQVFGHQTGLSPVAIVIAATFWTWLWGPIGLIVATPLTLCLVILGQYTKRLEFLHVLLGDQPALTPPESFYQRLIAGDPAEIIEQAERQIKDTDLATYFDDVALPGLVLAQLDVSSGELSPERQELVLDGVNELIDGLSQASVDRQPSTADDAPAVAQIDKVGGSHGLKVLCVAGRGAIDQTASLLLKHLLDQSGFDAQVGPDQGLKGIASSVPTGEIPEVIFVSYVGTAKVSHVRFVLSRLRRRFPLAKVHLAVWQLPKPDPTWQELKEGVPGVEFVSTMKEAAESSQRIMQQPRDQVSLMSGSAVTKLQTAMGLRIPETTHGSPKG